MIYNHHFHDTKILFSLFFFLILLITLSCLVHQYHQYPDGRITLINIQFNAENGVEVHIGGCKERKQRLGIAGLKVQHGWPHQFQKKHQAFYRVGGGSWQLISLKFYYGVF